MPTGYTAPIKDGISFEQYALGCARAFGALITMRDDPQDAPIPDSFEPDDYFSKRLAENKKKMEDLENATPYQIEIMAEADYRTHYENWKKWEDQKTELRDKYNEMLAKCQKWEPPSPGHEEFKKFMISQIQESIKWDCEPYAPPVKASPQNWLLNQIELIERSNIHLREQGAKEIERADGRTKWVQQLKQSLKNLETA